MRSLDRKRTFGKNEGNLNRALTLVNNNDVPILVF